VLLGAPYVQGESRLQPSDTSSHTRIEFSRIRACSRLAHSSSHRPTLVFHDPLCLKNAGRRTPNGSAFHPTGSTGLSRVTGIRTLELLPCLGPGPGPGLSNRVQRFISTRSRVLWESRPVRFCPVPGLRRWLHANGWVGNQRSRRVVWSPCRCLRSRQLVRRENGPRLLGSPSPSRTDDWVLSLVGNSDEAER
jgi:hypothetical protein